MIDYRLTLCKPNKEPICEINANNIVFTENFRSFDELSFTVPYYENNWQMNKDKRFDLTKALYYVYMEKVEDDIVKKDEYFVIDNPESSFSGEIINKNIHCFASHYMTFNKRILRAYKGVKLLYDASKPTDSKAGLLNHIIVSLYNTWTIQMDSIYEGVYHYFNYSSNTYTDVFQDVETQYNCFVLFDNVNNVIKIVNPATYGSDSGLILSNQNYIKSLSNTNKSNELITRLRVYGKKGISITKYNPIGQMYIDNFDWLIDNGYFSDGLKIAYNNYKILVSSKQSDFNSYITQLDGLESSLLTKQNELADLNNNRVTLEDSLKAFKCEYYSNNADYNTAYTTYQTKLSEISTKQTEINGLETQIDSVNDNINTLRVAISYDTNFSSSQLEELNQFIYESDLTLNSCDDEKKLYEYACGYIVKKSVPIVDITVSSIDVLSAKEAKLDRNKIIIGNFVYIDCPEIGFDYYQTRIVKIDHNQDSNSLSITLSNADKVNLEISYLNEIFKVSNQAGNTLLVNQDDYEAYTEDSDSILYNDDIITNPIQAGDTTLDNNGIVGSNSNGQLQIVGDRIIFSDDGFANWYSILSASKGLYFETDNKLVTVEINPNVGIKLQKADGLGGFKDSLYIDVETGEAIFGGSIQTLKDAHVGNNIYVGTPTNFANKGIYFYDDTVNVSNNIGIFLNEVEPNYFALTIQNNNRPITLQSNDDIFIGDEGTMTYLDLRMCDGYYSLCSSSDYDSVITHVGAGNLHLQHEGSGNLWLEHTGTGVLKIQASGDISIGSINKTTWITDWVRISRNTYSGGNEETNRIINKGEIQTLINDSGFAPITWVSSNFASISHSHGYATSSDISSAISAHVSAYHSS